MKKGFTLIELFILIAIIGILASIIITAIGSSSETSDGGKVQTDKEKCESYKYRAIRDLPAFCVKYYYDGDGQALR